MSIPDCSMVRVFIHTLRVLVWIVFIAVLGCWAVV